MTEITASERARAITWSHSAAPWSEVEQQIEQAILDAETAAREVPGGKLQVDELTSQIAALREAAQGYVSLIKSDYEGRHGIVGGMEQEYVKCERLLADTAAAAEAYTARIREKALEEAAVWSISLERLKAICDMAGGDESRPSLEVAESILLAARVLAMPATTEVLLKRRSIRDSLAFLLDSTVDLEPEDYDRETLLMRLEAFVMSTPAAADSRSNQPVPAKTLDWIKGGMNLGPNRDGLG